MTKRLGILAEDEVDVETVKELLRRVVPRDVGLSGRADNGCGQLRRKVARWIEDLTKRGCTAIIVVHDLDRDPISRDLNDEAALRRLLTEQAAEATVPHLICIPIEEIEAWFWCDPAVLQRIGRGKGHAWANPHQLPRPKETLIRASRDAGAQPRYSPNDNPRIAKELDLALCEKRCPAFKALKRFALSHSAAE